MSKPDKRPFIFDFASASGTTGADMLAWWMSHFAPVIAAYKAGTIQGYLMHYFSTRAWQTAWWGAEQEVAAVDPVLAQVDRQILGLLETAHIPYGFVVRPQGINLPADPSQLIAQNLPAVRSKLPDGVLNADEARRLYAYAIGKLRTRYDATYCRKFYIDSPLTGDAGAAALRLVKDEFPTADIIAEAGAFSFNWGASPPWDVATPLITLKNTAIEPTAITPGVMAMVDFGGYLGDPSLMSRWLAAGHTPACAIYDLPWIGALIAGKPVKQVRTSSDGNNSNYAAA